MNANAFQKVKGFFLVHHQIRMLFNFGRSHMLLAFVCFGCALCWILGCWLYHECSEKKSDSKGDWDELWSVYLRPDSLLSLQVLWEKLMWRTKCPILPVTQLPEALDPLIRACCAITFGLYCGPLRVIQFLEWGFKVIQERPSVPNCGPCAWGRVSIQFPVTLSRVP